MKLTGESMSERYERTPLSHGLHLGRERVSSIPLRGIPTLPEAANDFWRNNPYDDELPPRLQALCDEAIREAMAEHKRRREAIKQGLELLPDEEDID